MVSKALINFHKNKVHSSIEELESNINKCSTETPKSAIKAIEALNEAVENKTLYAEEANNYKKLISDYTNNFKKRCSCLIK